MDQIAVRTVDLDQIEPGAVGALSGLRESFDDTANVSLGHFGWCMPAFIVSDCGWPISLPGAFACFEPLARQAHRDGPA